MKSENDIVRCYGKVFIGIKFQCSLVPRSLKEFKIISVGSGKVVSFWMKPRTQEDGVLLRHPSPGTKAVNLTIFHQKMHFPISVNIDLILKWFGSSVYHKLLENRPVFILYLVFIHLDLTLTINTIGMLFLQIVLPPFKFILSLMNLLNIPNFNAIEKIFH